MYIRYDGKIEDRENGQRKMRVLGPRIVRWISKLNKRLVAVGFSLLMGREFDPDQYAILLDFDCKLEGDTHSGLGFVEKLDMD